VHRLLLIYGIYLFFGQGPWSTKSKRFKLYKVLIDQNKVPDSFVTVLRGDIPHNTVSGFVTYVLPRVAARRGLKAHQFVGVLHDFKKGFTPANFAGNRAFKDMIHSIASKHIPEVVHAEAKQIGAGEVRLLDDRVASQSTDAVNEHCIGFYTVANGQVVAYAPNPNFRLFSEQGPLELVECIRAVLYAEIGNIASTAQE
jgi:hypothetical protein